MDGNQNKFIAHAINFYPQGVTCTFILQSFRNSLVQPEMDQQELEPGCIDLKDCGSSIMFCVLPSCLVLYSASAVFTLSSEHVSCKSREDQWEDYSHMTHVIKT